MKKLLIIISCFISCFGEGIKSKNDIADNIQITAESMEYNTSQREADAAGNVVLRYEVNKTPVVLKAEKLHVIFDDHGNLVIAIAEENVEIDHKETKLHAAKCTHDFKENIAVCAGDDVQLLQDKNELHGTKATLDIKAHVFTMHTEQQEQISCVVYPDKE